MNHRSGVVLPVEQHRATKLLQKNVGKPISIRLPLDTEMMLRQKAKADEDVNISLLCAKALNLYFQFES